MREIKFRAWLKKEKKMVDVDFIGFDRKVIGYDIYSNNAKSNENYVEPVYGYQYFKNIELMQFAGVYDKNGTPIYEGDIVENSKIKLRSAVRFNQKDGSFKLFKLGDTEACPSADLAKKFAVIGNIYENAEMLRSEEE